MNYNENYTLDPPKGLGIVGLSFAFVDTIQEQDCSTELEFHCRDSLSELMCFDMNFVDTE